MLQGKIKVWAALQLGDLLIIIKYLSFSLKSNHFEHVPWFLEPTVSGKTLPAFEVRLKPLFIVVLYLRTFPPAPDLCVWAWHTPSSRVLWRMALTGHRSLQVKQERQAAWHMWQLGDGACYCRGELDQRSTCRRHIEADRRESGSFKEKQWHINAHVKYNGNKQLYLLWVKLVHAFLPSK